MSTGFELNFTAGLQLLALYGFATEYNVTFGISIVMMGLLSLGSMSNANPLRAFEPALSDACRDRHRHCHSCHHHHRQSSDRAPAPRCGQTLLMLQSSYYALKHTVANARGKEETSLRRKSLVAHVLWPSVFDSAKPDPGPHEANNVYRDLSCPIYKMLIVFLGQMFLMSCYLSQLYTPNFQFACDALWRYYAAIPLTFGVLKRVQRTAAPSCPAPAVARVQSHDACAEREH